VGPLPSRGRGQRAVGLCTAGTFLTPCQRISTRSCPARPRRERVPFVDQPPERSQPQAHRMFHRVGPTARTSPTANPPRSPCRWAPALVRAARLRLRCTLQDSNAGHKAGPWLTTIPVSWRLILPHWLPEQTDHGHGLARTACTDFASKRSSRKARHGPHHLAALPARDGGRRPRRSH